MLKKESKSELILKYPVEKYCKQQKISYKFLGLILRLKVIWGIFKVNLFKATENLIVYYCFGLMSLNCAK